jgi:hypothetical protein
VEGRGNGADVEEPEHGKPDPDPPVPNAPDPQRGQPVGLLRSN